MCLVPRRLRFEASEGDLCRGLLGLLLGAPGTRTVTVASDLHGALENDIVRRAVGRNQGVSRLLAAPCQFFLQTGLKVARVLESVGHLALENVDDGDRGRLVAVLQITCLLYTSPSPR